MTPAPRGGNGGVGGGERGRGRAGTQQTNSQSRNIGVWISGVARREACVLLAQAMGGRGEEGGFVAC